MTQLIRELLPDGQLRLSSGVCSFVFRRYPSATLLVTITGDDRGELGTAPLDEIRFELMRNRPLEVFVDARAVTNASVAVSREWTHFFAENKNGLKRVVLLGGSRVVNLTLAIAQHLSHTGNLIQIHSDPQTFEARLAMRAA